MDLRNRHTETLQYAAAILGGTERLANFLNVSRARLARWLAGEEAPPEQAYLDALDVLADGPPVKPEDAQRR